MPNKKAALFGLFIVLLTSVCCRAHRQVVDLQPNTVRDSSLTDTGVIGSTLKITAISLPPQPFSYDRLEVTLQDPNLGDRMQKIDPYKINTSIPVKAHKNYNLTVRAYSGDDVIYSSEYCKTKKSFRSNVGVMLLTVSLCEAPDDLEDDDDPTPTN